MPQYRVLGGKHREADGKVFRKGDIVTLTEELAASFRNKFQLVADDEIPEPPKAPPKAPPASTQPKSSLAGAAKVAPPVSTAGKK